MVVFGCFFCFFIRRPAGRRLNHKTQNCQCHDAAGCRWKNSGTAKPVEIINYTLGDFFFLIFPPIVIEGKGGGGKPNGKYSYTFHTDSFYHYDNYSLYSCWQDRTQLRSLVDNLSREHTNSSTRLLYINLWAVQ